MNKCLFVWVLCLCPPSVYNFWYSSLPSSFFVSATLRTALLKSS